MHAGEGSNAAFECVAAACFLGWEGLDLTIYSITTTYFAIFTGFASFSNGRTY